MGNLPTGSGRLTYIPLSEVFGPTFQGEGPYAGLRATFIRLGGCNLACSWCDTAYTWDGSRYDLRQEIRLTPVSAILDDVSARDGIVVITGGEPLIHAHTAAFATMLHGLRELGRPLHLESNGTILPPRQIADLLDVIVLSPKLANAGEHRGAQDASVDPRWADVALQQEVHLKFVCIDREDVREAVRMADWLGWSRSRVWVMPEGTSSTVVQGRFGAIAEVAIELGINVTSRLHILAWGNERGR